MHDRAGFSIVDGGRNFRAPRLLVVDIDAADWLALGTGGQADENAFSPRLAPTETALIRRARERMDVLAMSCHARSARAVLDACGLGDMGIVAPDPDLVPEGRRADPSPLSIPAKLAEALAACCGERGLPLRSVALLAASPIALGAMLEARWAGALKDAGREACLAADRVFAARSRGGLADAIAWALGLLGDA
ncbi:MAG: hypothetical protein SOU51_02110 [Collinsella sp.]|nr:hypothetical protein [Collinsella sp.]